MGFKYRARQQIRERETEEDPSRSLLRSRFFTIYLRDRDQIDQRIPERETRSGSCGRRGAILLARFSPAERSRGGRRRGVQPRSGEKSAPYSAIVHARLVVRRAARVRRRSLLARDFFSAKLLSLPGSSFVAALSPPTTPARRARKPRALISSA